MDGDNSIDIQLEGMPNGTVTMPYIFSGFSQPINDTAHQIGQDLSVFKAGSTVPIKFQLKKSDGTITQTTTLPVFLNPEIISSTSASIDESIYSLPATTGNTFRWDSTSQQYIYNWSTKGTTSPGNLYKISVKLDDGGTYFVTVGLR